MYIYIYDELLLLFSRIEFANYYSHRYTTVREKQSNLLLMGVWK